MYFKIKEDEFGKILNEVNDIQAISFLNNVILDIALSGTDEETLLYIEDSALYLNNEMRNKIAEIRELLGKHEILK